MLPRPLHHSIQLFYSIKVSVCIWLPTVLEEQIAPNCMHSYCMYRQQPETTCSRNHKLTWHAANVVVANTVRAGGAEDGTKTRALRRCAAIDPVVVVERVATRRGWRATQHRGRTMQHNHVYVSRHPRRFHDERGPNNLVRNLHNLNMTTPRLSQIVLGPNYEAILRCNTPRCPVSARF